MSLRAFTVFQDTPSGEQRPPKVMRPIPITTRSLTNNNVAPLNISATVSTPDIDKENYDPLTGERAGPGGSTAGKKRKTGILATKAQRQTDKCSQPEKKKRKPSPPSSNNSAEAKPVKKSLKASGNSRKGKRTGSRKVSPMPKLPEEDEVGKVIIPATQREIDSKCKELTLKPLADVSEAYDELSVFCPSPSAGEEGSEMLRHGTVKAPSVEPEIRDYFEPSGCLSASSSASTRLNALSEDVPELRTFSTPERKQIYAAFIFSSPSRPCLLASKSSRDDDIPSTLDLA